MIDGSRPLDAPSGAQKNALTIYLEAPWLRAQAAGRPIGLTCRRDDRKYHYHHATITEITPATSADSESTYMVKWQA